MSLIESSTPEPYDYSSNISQRRAELETQIVSESYLRQKSFN